MKDFIGPKGDAVLSKTISLPFIKKTFPTVELFCLISVFVFVFLGAMQFVSQVGEFFFISLVFMCLFVLLRGKIYIDVPFLITVMFCATYCTSVWSHVEFTPGTLVGVLLFYPGLYQFGRALYDHEKGKGLLFALLLTFAIGYYVGMMLNVVAALQIYGPEFQGYYIPKIWNHQEHYARTLLSIFIIPLTSFAYAFLIKRSRYQNWLTIILAVLTIVGATAATFYVSNRSFIIVEAALIVFIGFYLIFKIKNHIAKLSLCVVFAGILVVGVLTFQGIGPLGEWFASTHLGQRFLEGSDSGRWRIYELYFANFQNYPFGGLNELIKYAHNIVMDFYVFGGIVPFLCSTAFFIRLIVLFVKMMRRGLMKEPEWFFAFFTMMGMFFEGLFEPAFQANSYYFFIPFLTMAWLEGLMLDYRRLSIAEASFGRDPFPPKLKRLQME